MEFPMTSSFNYRGKTKGAAKVNGSGKAEQLDTRQLSFFDKHLYLSAGETGRIAGAFKTFVSYKPHVLGLFMALLRRSTQYSPPSLSSASTRVFPPPPLFCHFF